MPSRPLHLIATLFALSTFICPLLGENWPSWRGPGQAGVSHESGLPTRWSQSDNIRWRVDLPGTAPSTPVVWEDRIYLTSSEGESLWLLCLDTSGKELWRRPLGAGNTDIREGESNAVSPSPCTDGEYVWTYTGTGILSCFDKNGMVKWTTDIQKEYGEFEIWWGMSTSPLLDGDRLYLALMHTGAQLVIAFNKLSGKEIWKQQRKTDARAECLHSYASPVMYSDGQEKYLLTHGADYIVAHRLADGAELWRCGGFQAPNNYNEFLRLVASPVTTPGLIVVPTAKNGPVLGINPAMAAGDITSSSNNFHWRWENNTPDVPSPLIHDGLVYLCRENGVLICIDAKNGEEVYKESVYRRRHRGSPVYADGNILLTAFDGTVSVIRAGRVYELVAQNSLDEQMSASPAISGGTIYLRSSKALYAISK